MRSNWYLFADDLNRDLEWRTFALTRVEKVKRAGKKFVPNPLFDFEARMQGGIGAVAVASRRRSGSTSRAHARAFVLERHWHVTEKVTSLADGALEMTLTAPVNEELLRWIRE